jgi:hypothetical protein
MVSWLEAVGVAGGHMYTFFPKSAIDICVYIGLFLQRTSRRTMIAVFSSRAFCN